MKANELRIGNYYLSFGVDLKQVETLHKDKILIDFTPIPLTEEWLLKFGFELINESPINYKVYELKFISFNVVKDFKQNLYEVEVYSVTYPIIKYVHQLQNLYFALTNEELTIKDEN